MSYQRHSSRLAPRQCHQLATARNHAQYIEKPLNYTATIHWAVADGVGTADKRCQKLFETTRHWFTRRNSSFYCVWVFEAATGGKDVHTHLAFHLPDHIDANDLEDYWRDRLGRTYENALDIEPAHSDGYGIIGWQRYMFKEASPRMRKLYRVPSTFRPQQGLIVGKRAGFTQNLGPKAIERYLQERKARAVA